MFPFHGSDYVDLTSTWRKRSAIPAANTKQNKFSCIAEVKTYTSTVWSPIFCGFYATQGSICIGNPIFAKLQCLQEEAH